MEQQLSFTEWYAELCAKSDALGLERLDEDLATLEHMDNQSVDDVLEQMKA